MCGPRALSDDMFSSGLGLCIVDVPMFDVIFSKQCNFASNTDHVYRGEVLIVLCGLMTPLLAAVGIKFA